MPANGGVAAGVAAIAQILEHADQRQPFAGRLAVILQKQCFELPSPRPDPGLRLAFPLVVELGRFRPDDLANHFSRDAKIATDCLDRLLLREKRLTDFGNRFHDQHLDQGPLKIRKPIRALVPGVPIGRRSPPKRGPYSTPIHNFIAEFVETLGDLVTTTLMAADECDRMRTVAYLTLLSRTLANALRVAADLGKAEATT